MTALPVHFDPTPSADIASKQANAWVAMHHDELVSRASAYFSRLPLVHREEAVAEVVARAVAWALSAARRGKLHRVTAYWVVIYAAQQLRSGRSFAGTSSRCVMSEAARVRRGIRIASLHDEIDNGKEKPLMLRDSLADHDAENPFDIVRRESDYPKIFEVEDLSPKALATFQFLADTKSEGRQCELADELGVTPARVTQLKDEIGTALSRHGYTAPLGRRPTSQAT